MNFGSFLADKVLSDSVNAILNENWRDILEDLRTPFEDSMANLLKSVIRPFFASLPYAEYFLTAEP